MNAQINDFVHDALERGVSREDIGRGLLDGGWSKKEINTALDAYVDCGLPLPVPRKRVSGTAREAFLFLMLFSAMYTTVFSLGAVLFDMINIFLPDPDEVVLRWIISLRYGLATVIVAFPIFLFMGRILQRETVCNPGQRISPVRRWLTYLTLFVASASIVTDLIILIVSFLSGDMTVRFGLKVLVVGIMAGTVLIYYLRDLQHDEVAPSAEYHATGSGKLAKVTLIAAVLIIIGSGFWVTGSPMKARLYAQDDQRVNDISQISRKVQLYYKNRGELPDSLSACDVSPETYIGQKTDRVTGAPFRYRVINTTHFELGATFAMPSRTDVNYPKAGAFSGGYGFPNPGFWQHDAGQVTFTIDVSGKSTDE